MSQQGTRRPPGESPHPEAVPASLGPPAEQVAGIEAHAWRDWLPSLAQAEAAEGRERARALQRLQEELGALGADPALAEARAQHLLSLLSGEGLEARVGDRGWTARAMVTAALLNHGGATALLLHPDDLQHLREVRARAQRGLRRGTLAASLVTGLAAWSGLLLSLRIPDPGTLLELCQMGAVAYGLLLPPVLLSEVIRRRILWRRQPNVRGVD